MGRLLETLSSGLQKSSWNYWRKKRDLTVLFNLLLLNFGHSLNNKKSWNSLIWGKGRGKTLTHVLFITGINKKGGNVTSHDARILWSSLNSLPCVKWGSKGVWTSRVSRWPTRQLYWNGPWANAILLSRKIWIFSFGTNLFECCLLVGYDGKGKLLGSRQTWVLICHH